MNVKTILLSISMYICMVYTSGGSRCSDISGHWHNQHGSVIHLHKNAITGQLTGTYSTKVQATKGHVDIEYPLDGISDPINDNPIFGFAVEFKDGQSSSAWTGQCHVCDGQETLMTHWLLRTKMESCEHHWKSTMIGQDYFIRMNTKTNTYSSSRRKRETRYNEAPLKCSLSGYWYNNLGSKAVFSQQTDDNNAVNGIYKTAVERSKGSSGDSHSLIYGITDWKSSNAVSAFFVMWNHGQSVTAWIGQCQLCEHQQRLVTKWLLRHRVDDCQSNWQSTFYGETSFYRQNFIRSHEKYVGRINALYSMGEPTTSATEAVHLCKYYIILLFSVYVFIN